jgi:hypothetical protein
MSVTGGRFTLGLGRGIEPLFDAFGLPRITSAQIGVSPDELAPVVAAYRVRRRPTDSTAWPRTRARDQSRYGGRSRHLRALTARDVRAATRSVARAGEGRTAL